MIQQNTTTEGNSVCYKVWSLKFVPSMLSSQTNQKRSLKKKISPKCTMQSEFPLLSFHRLSLCTQDKCLDVQRQVTSKLAVSNFKYRLLFFLGRTEKWLAELPVLLLNFDDSNWKEKIKDSTLWKNAYTEVPWTWIISNGQQGVTPSVSKNIRLYVSLWKKWFITSLHSYGLNL